MDFDVVICGAGVVGLAVAAELSKQYTCLVIEKESGFGKATSSRNSEVIHAGLYYPPGSLKSSLCIEGNRLIYAWCKEHNVPFKKIGKYLTANNIDEEKRLTEIFHNAIACGAKGLRWTGKEEMQSEEPYVKCTSALFSSETGIIDTHSFMYSLETTAITQDCIMLYNHKMLDFQNNGSYLNISIMDSDANEYIVSCKHFINAAGLYSDIIAEKTGVDITKEDLILEYWKGHYYKLIPSKSHYASHLIYPVQCKNSKGLGVHLTKDMDGYIKFGPDAEFVKGKVEEYNLKQDKKQNYFSIISTYLYDIQEDDLSFDQIGIRPKLNTKYTSYRDYYIKNISNRKDVSIINLIGIESPGITSSLAIGKKIKSMVSS